MSYVLNSESRLFVMLSEEALTACDSGDKPSIKALTDARELCSLGDQKGAEKALARLDKRVDKITTKED